MLVATREGGTFTFEEMREDLAAASCVQAGVRRRDETMYCIVVAKKPAAKPLSVTLKESVAWHPVEYEAFAFICSRSKAMGVAYCFTLSRLLGKQIIHRRIRQATTSPWESQFA